MADHTYNVLFLCTGNSARSILAESLLNQWGRGGFRGFSTGSHPKGQVHMIALEARRWTSGRLFGPSFMRSRTASGSLSACRSPRSIV